MAFLSYLRLQWDRAGATLAVLLGALVLLLGWIGVSGTGLVSAQLPYYISGGLAGIFLLGIGATLWLSADLRDEWRELRELRLMLREVIDVNDGNLLGVRPAASHATVASTPVPALAPAAAHVPVAAAVALDETGPMPVMGAPTRSRGTAARPRRATAAR